MPSPSPKVTSHVVKLSPEQIDQLHGLLAARGWAFSTLPYAHWKAQQGRTTIAAYQSGKTLIQGAQTQDVVQFLLEPEILHEATLGYESLLAEVENPTMFEPHAGIDESGKGDFFGPLVVVCAYTEKSSAQQLQALGVRDSKLVSSDTAILSLARQIRGILQEKYSVVFIPPAKLNELYAKMENLNRILAWGHARALENLLEKVPDCPRAISDQFGQGNLVKRHLMERGQKIILDEHPKAEADIAVAAASILAREKFVIEMQKLSSQAGLLLPKGAGPKVVSTAQEFLKLHSREELNAFAKTFFKTTEALPATKP